MAIAGLPDPQEDHSARAARFALAAVAAAQARGPSPARSLDAPIFASFLVDFRSLFALTPEMKTPPEQGVAAKGADDTSTKNKK